jgi:3',5'-cyclic-AMP phosphodiesterase
MHHIIQLSDLHILENLYDVKKERAPAKQLISALEDINVSFPYNKTIVLTGDLVSDATAKAYILLSTLLENTDADIYVTPGNHDDPILLKTHFKSAKLVEAQEIYIDNWLGILIDTSPPGKNLGSGYILPNELKRVEFLLEKNKDKYILIFMHHPSYSFGAKWFQEICLENKKEFESLLDRYSNIKGVIMGHAHTQCVRFHHNRFYSCAPSSWVQFNHLNDEKLITTNESGGYNWYSLKASGEILFGTRYFNTK